MPNVAGEDEEEAYRRQNRAGQFFLDVDVALDKVGIRCDSAFTQRIDVMAVQPFIESSSVEPRRGVENPEDVKGAVSDETGWRQTNKNADDENSRKRQTSPFDVSQFR